MSRTQRFEMRLTPEEWAAWTESAESEGVTVAELVRRRMGGGPVVPSPPPPAPLPQSQRATVGAAGPPLLPVTGPKSGVNPRWCARCRRIGRACCAECRKAG